MKRCANLELAALNAARRLDRIEERRGVDERPQERGASISKGERDPLSASRQSNIHDRDSRRNVRPVERRQNERVEAVRPCEDACPCGAVKGQRLRMAIDERRPAWIVE